MFGFKKIGILIAFLIVSLVAYNLVNQIFGAFKASDRLSEAAGRLYSLEIKNKELKDTLKNAKTPDFIEEQARNKLGLVKEGETVIVISQEKIKQVLGAKRTEEIKLPNPLGWLRLFFK